MKNKNELDNFNLDGMWSDEIKKQKEVIETKYEFINYLYLKRNNDLCSGTRFNSEFIGNNHPTKTIIATVETEAVYLGRVTNSIKEVIVKPGEANLVNLGCTGFDNPAGYDTVFNRSIKDGVFQD